MCVQIDSDPPIAQISGASVNTKNFTLVSADGAELSAFEANTELPGSIGVVILPGLFHFYEELAVRFAEHGYSAVCIDYFGRTVGIEKRDGKFPFMEHIAQTKVEEIADDVASAVTHLRESAGSEQGSIFTVGFCFGASNSWLQASAAHGLSGAVGFYGHPTRIGVDGWC